MRPKLLFYVQHLLGIGHLVRCYRLARGLAADGFAVTIVSGGLPTPGLDPGDAALVQLPPVKAGAGFAGLVHAEGSAFSTADQERRRDLLIKAFDDVAPDVLITEAFPFGRRQMRFELLPLLDHARRCETPPVIAASIRDILQENRKPGRAEETVDLIERYYDLVLVHGDDHMCRLEETFPQAGQFEEKIAYTGLVGPEPSPRPDDVHDVIVSAGGGAVGAALLRTSLLAKPLTALHAARWLIVTGPNMSEADEATLRELGGSDVTLARFVTDLPARLCAAKLSISQAGYNTVADLLVANCKTVLVPFAIGGETEQPLRARLMEEHGLGIALPEELLSPDSLAEAIGRALMLPAPKIALSLDGTAETARILLRRLEQ